MDPSSSTAVPVPPTNLFEELSVFIDPSLPTNLAKQLTVLLSHNRAKIASSLTPNLDLILPSLQPLQPDLTKTSSTNQNNLTNRSSANRHHHLISNLKPRFDLTSTTHIITSSLHLPEYLALGRSDQADGDIISFSYRVDSDYDDPSTSSDQTNHHIIHRTIYLVTPLWVTQSYDLNKLLPTNAYSPDPYKFFSGIVVAIDSGARLPTADIELIQGCLQAWGGQFRKVLTKEVTHLICCDEQTRDYKIAFKLRVPLSLKIVLPHWFHHCVYFRKVIPEAPFEFPSPEILKPRSPSMSPDRQHGINGFPGTNLPPLFKKPVQDDSDVESWSHKTATKLAFDHQNISTRSVSQGLSDYLEETNPDSLKTNEPIKRLSKPSQPSAAITPAHREFQNKSVYLVSSLALSLSARKTLIRRIEELGAKVFDGHGSILENPDRIHPDTPQRLRNAVTAEQELTSCDIVICEYRTGWEFWLAWDLNKQIGTLHWILCILNNTNSPTSVVRPSTERLLDFPCPLEPISGCDLENRPITITNYTGTARSYLIRLIEKMHLKFSGSLEFETVMVVAANKAGSKVTYATKLGTQIVNHYYIEECFLNWSKQSIQPHHVSYPEGINLCESVGQTTRGIESIYKWTKRSEVKEQKKRDLSILPSKLVNNPPEAILLSNTVPETEAKRSNSPISPLPLEPPSEILQSSVPQFLTVKRVQRKPRLITDSIEPSANTTPEVELAHEVDLPDDNLINSPEKDLMVPSKNDSIVTTEKDSIMAPEKDSRSTRESNSSQESVEIIRENEVQSTSKTPRSARRSPLKRTSTQLDLNPLPSKNTKVNSQHLDRPEEDYNAPPQSPRSCTTVLAENFPNDALSGETISAIKSSVSSATNTPSQPSRKKAIVGDLDPLAPIKQPMTPLAAPRSSARKAAQIACRNVKNAAEDMNLHEKEKKRKRNSVGIEDGGYYGLPPKPSSSASKKIKDRTNSSRENESETDQEDKQEIESKKTGSDRITQFRSQNDPKSREPKRLCKSRKGAKGRPRREEEGEQHSTDDNDMDELPDLDEIENHINLKNKRKFDDGCSSKKTLASSCVNVRNDSDDMRLEEPKKLNQKKTNKPSKADDQVKGTTVLSSSKHKTSLKESAHNHNVRKICISQSGERIEPKVYNKLVKMGAKFIDSTPTVEDGCTHLLTTKIARTEKFLSCILLGCLIVDHQWAIESARKSQFVDEQDYELKDSEGERLHGFRLKKSLEISRSTQILDSFEIFLTPHVSSLNSKLLKKLIVLAGGKVLNKLPAIEELERTAKEYISSKQRDRKRISSVEDPDLVTHHKKSIVISSKEDFKFLKNNLIKKFPSHFEHPIKDSIIKIFDSNLILEGLLIQQIKFEPQFELDYSELIQP